MGQRQEKLSVKQCLPSLPTPHEEQPDGASKHHTQPETKDRPFKRMEQGSFTKDGRCCLNKVVFHPLNIPPRVSLKIIVSK